MDRRHLPSSGRRRRQPTSCLPSAAELSAATPDYSIDELADTYPDVIFRTAAEAAANADMRFDDAAIVWRLPCGAYVWTPADDSRVVSVAGLIPLSELWVADAHDGVDRESAADAIGPQEVLWRDCGDGEWERAE